MNEMISTKDLCLSYGKKQTFQDISISFPKNSVTGIVGPSGCGKTSFLSCLNRLIELQPGVQLSGEVFVEGEGLYEKSHSDLRALRKKVGMVFQKPNPFPFSIRKNLELPLKEHGMKSKRDRALVVRRVLEDVGLWDEVSDRLDDSATQLSGGQQQRLCIARALTLEPSVLLMDEPCSSLDPISSGVIEELIVRLKEKLTIVVVTHNLIQAKRISDYVAFFCSNGSICSLVEYGKCEEFFQKPVHPLTRAYLGESVGTVSQ